MRSLNPTDVINHGNFFQDTLRHTSAFIRYCKERGIDISERRLEKFEKFGIFLPVLRINRPILKIKRRRIKTEGEPDRFEEFGVLQDGDKWDGEIREEYAAFIHFDKEYVDSWINEGLITVPRKGQFTPWRKYKDKRGHDRVDTYYSIFQTLPLQLLVQSLDVRLNLEDLAKQTRKQTLEFHKTFSKHSKGVLNAFNSDDNAWDRYAQICLLLSRRYLPEAKSEGVLITVPAKEFTKFDFFDYRRNWKAKEFLAEIGLSAEEIKKAWEGVAHRADHINPLGLWDDLLEIIKRDERKRLKGDALLAETWRMMAKMLNLFYEDLTGERLYLYGRSPETIEIYRGKGITKNDLRYKEFVANEFGVNPRPKLILMVEGHGEFEEFPKLLKWAFGHTFASYGIQIMNFETVGEFNFRNMRRFVDHFHALQTIVYFILDNENNALETRNKLSRANSRYISGFSITKRELFTIWNKNVEFDNFSDVEIAQALTTVSEGRYIFSEHEMNNVRIAFGTGGDTISSLYESKLSYGLSKPKLLSLLFENFNVDIKVDIEGVLKTRPILDVVDNLRHLALKNYQPSSLDAWKETQNSEWLRTKLS